MENSRFPNKLKLCRHAEGYSQKKVARILRLADTSIVSRWEQGVVVPNTRHVFHLAQLYHIQPHELFDGLWQHYVSENNLLAPDAEPFSSRHSFFV